MKRRITTLGLALALLAGQAAPALAATKGETKAKEAAAAAKRFADWSAVRAIPAGEKIVVRMKDGSRYTGRFENASDLTVSLLRDGRSVSLERERIRRVSQKGGTSRRNGALWGLAIGAGSGAVVGAGMEEAGAGEFDDILFPFFTAVGAGLGTVIGAAFGKGKKDVTIYEAP